MNLPTLTERQQEVLDFIRAFQSDEGVPPSTREIQRHFRFASQTAVMGHLRSLANKGMVEQLAGRSWGLKASEVQTHFELNVYGSIPAGLPEAREQEPAERVRIDPAVFGLRMPALRPSGPGAVPAVWGLRVSGDSMIGAHILDGDLAVLARREPRPGDIVAALVDETTTTLKRLVHVRGKPVLRAENPRYRDIVPERRLESQGVLVGLVRRFPREK
ncbi:MAG: transcriptional repressor LexA [Opitutaceae bacterium]